MRMRATWQITAVMFLVLSMIIILIALNSYPYGDRLGPGPAFFPVWSSILNILFTSILLYQTVTGRDGLDASAKLTLPDGPMARRSLVCFLGLIGCAVLLEPLGFCLTVFLFLVFVPFGLGIRCWWCLLVFSLGFSTSTFYVLYKLMFVPLPLGILSL